MNKISYGHTEYLIGEIRENDEINCNHSNDYSGWGDVETIASAYGVDVNEICPKGREILELMITNQIAEADKAMLQWCLSLFLLTVSAR